MQASDLARSDASELPVCVIQICPGSEDDRASMSFVRRQAEDLRAIGVSVLEVFVEDRQSIGGLIRGRTAVRAAIKKHKPDIVHAQYGTVTAMVGILCGFRPLAVTFRGSDLHPDSTSSRLKMAFKIFMSQMGALFSTRIITVSDALANRLWWKWRKVAVIPSGVNVEKFCPIEKELAREHLDWNLQDKVIFFNSARNPQNKRLDIAEEVAKGVRKIYPESRLYVLEGNTDPSEVPWILNACDVLLMLSNFEGSPNVVKEAMACNLPIVSFDVGDVVERLSGVTGCKIVPRDTDSVVNAVISCLAARSRSDGRSHIDSISAQASAMKLRALYLSMLGRGAV